MPLLVCGQVVCRICPIIVMLLSFRYVVHAEVEEVWLLAAAVS